MGSIGTSSSTAPSTRYNEQGFEVENSNSPDVEFTDTTWNQMARLRELGGFTNPDLADLVDSRISELVDQYGDLEAYNSDLTTLRERIEGSNITDDEYWAGYHVMANMLGIQAPRYTVMDNNQSPWDEKFGSVEQAEQWANERNDAKYVYDTWTRKMRRIGGKNWR